jgi:hypothetical protein
MKRDYEINEKGFGCLVLGVSEDFKSESNSQNQIPKTQNLFHLFRNPSSFLALAFSAIAFLVYYGSNPNSEFYHDYTFRIAQALIEGRLSMIEEPPPALNEMVPLNGSYYSVFPLGSVLTMLPVAALKKLGLIDSFPGLLISALLAGIITFLLFKISAKFYDNPWRIILLTLFPVFGTWMWANLAFAGAWQIALGAAVAGQLAAIYFTIIKPSPLLAGLCFAVAFGNRTEVILTAPIFIYLIFKRSKEWRWGEIIRFLLIPVALGIATLAYNFARFSSIFDFGYARIPGVLDEPWYRHGIFSLYAIPGNAHAMLVEPWKLVEGFPHIVPTGFGGSILLSSPFLIFLFRRGSLEPHLKLLSWCAIGILTAVLWCHGNTGGWQFSYRYAMVLLPWMFLILLGNSPKKPSVPEIALLIISILINAFGTYLFLWTNYILNS